MLSNLRKVCQGRLVLWYTTADVQECALQTCLDSVVGHGSPCDTEYMRDTSGSIDRISAARDNRLRDTTAAVNSTFQ